MLTLQVCYALNYLLPALICLLSDMHYVSSSCILIQANVTVQYDFVFKTYIHVVLFQFYSVMRSVPFTCCGDYVLHYYNYSLLVKNVSFIADATYYHTRDTHMPALKPVLFLLMKTKTKNIH